MVDAVGKRLAEDQRLPLVIDPEDMIDPKTTTPAEVKALTYEQRLQRQIDMLNAAMSKYERVTLAGGELSGDDEGRLMKLVDGARKLELALSQIRAKDSGLNDSDDLTLALLLIDKGQSLEQVLANFKHNLALEQQLKDALDDRK
jgi:hypothetical protein